MSVDPVGAISPKIIQLENMLAASATFRAAIGSAVNCEQAKERIHYSYALMGDEGSDPAANLERFAQQLPIAVILSHEQLGYGFVAGGAKHYLRAEGSMGLLLLFRDEVSGHDPVQCKEREIRMSNFHGSVIDEIADLAGEEIDGVTYAPIDQISLDVPPMRSAPYMDQVEDELGDDGEPKDEAVPYYLVGYSLHWK